MKEIILTQGYIALVDDEDFEFLSQWKWFAQRMSHTVYAARKPWVVGGKGKSIKIFMHRIILDTPDHMQTDHMDGNGLNNQRSNLRVVTRRDNMLNRARWTKDNISKFRGAYLDKRDGKWASSITINGKCFYLGRFKTEEEAGLAYRSKRVELLNEKFIREDVL